MKVFLTSILKEELVTAAGCTEPIAIALCSAKCREILDMEPETIEINVSGNVIKNAKGVVIPGTKDLVGIEYSAILGSIVKKSSRSLEVLNGLEKKYIDKAKKIYNKKICVVKRKDTDIKLYIEIIMKSGKEVAQVEISHHHTNFSVLKKNGKDIFHNSCEAENLIENKTDRSCLSVKNILEYAQTVDIEHIKEVLDRQLEYNSKIAREGLSNKYGLCSGKIIFDMAGGLLKEEMKGFAACGSDARMSGCDLPVVINSGSGNQGITIGASLSKYYEKKEIEDEDKYRSLAIANLIGIHIKSKIGRLSAFCGVVSASIGVGAALTYLESKDQNKIEKTIKNGIANLTGVICDGAKCSCAIKIASSLDAGIIAHHLGMQDRVVGHGIGIINESVEETINNLVEIATEPMILTDEKIFEIMLRN